MAASGWCGQFQSELAASWFEAGGTIAGATVASLVAVFVWKTWQSTKRQLAEAERQTQAARQQARSAEQQLTLERDRDEQRFAMARREQADQVSAWLVRGISVSKDLTDIHVVNSSSQPVYRLALYVQIGLNLSTHERFRRSMLGPTPPGMVEPIFGGLDLVERDRMDEADANQQPSGLCLSFTDIHGQDWTRRSDGELVPGRERFIPSFEEQQLKDFKKSARSDMP